MEFKIIDINTIVSEEELLPVIEENIKTASFHREQIKRMKQTSKPKTVIIPPEISHPQHFEIDTTEKDDFEDEVEYYLSQLKEINPDKIEEQLTEALPVRLNKNYKKIILRLILESLRNIHEMEEVLEEYSEEDQEDIEMFQEEIRFEQRKISLLNKSLEHPQQKIIEEEQPKDNKLIFVPTSGGNIRILDEIERIPEEFYESFVSLFNSIKDGTFKNVKRFTNNNALNGICEVKDLKVRVVFVRLDKNSYALLTAFVKKTQNDKGYSDALKNKVADYRVIADILKRNLENEEFLKLQQEYEQELYRKLNTSFSEVKEYEKGAK